MKKFQPRFARFSGSYPPRQQRGVVLLFALIAVTIMLVGAVGLISSFNTSLVSAGNIGFKRDLANQAERAISKVMLEFVGTGGLNTTALRGSDKGNLNYSATVLPTNNQGIPTALLQKTDIFDNTWTAADVASASGQKVTVRYLVDRLCTQTGDANLELPPGACIRGGTGQFLPDSGDETRMRSKAEEGRAGVASTVPNPAAYRVTVRAFGPRNTEAFYQVTFTEPLPPPAALPP